MTISVSQSRFQGGRLHLCSGASWQGLGVLYNTKFSFIPPLLEGLKEVSLLGSSEIGNEGPYNSLKELRLGLPWFWLRKKWLEGEIGSLWVQILVKAFRSPFASFNCSAVGYTIKFLQVNLILKFFSSGFDELEPRACSMRSRSPWNSLSWIRVGVRILPFQGMVRVIYRGNKELRAQIS